ncbi:hypothetical protein V8E54_000623 [Elaphomyces granulatus]
MDELPAEKDCLSVASTASNLLPCEVRRRIYEMTGLIHRDPILLDEGTYWRSLQNEYLQIGKVIPKQLFYTSRDVSNDALSMFWAENDFWVNQISFPLMLQIRSPIMWSSIRDLNVYIDLGSVKGHVDVVQWRSVCNNLGVHLPPSQLTLHLHITNEEGSLSTLEDMLHSILKLPILKRVYLLVSAQGTARLPMRQKACNLVRHLSAPASPTEDHPPFRFMDLLLELQWQILEYTDLVAPGAVTFSNLKGFSLLQCLKSCTRKLSLTTGTLPCSEAPQYDSSKEHYWSLPLGLFLINRHISDLSRSIFFDYNHSWRSFTLHFHGDDREGAGLIFGT